VVGRYQNPRPWLYSEKVEGEQQRGSSAPGHDAIWQVQEGWQRHRNPVKRVELENRLPRQSGWMLHIWNLNSPQAVSKRNAFVTECQTM
jgi:hypothetical protein